MINPMKYQHQVAQELLPYLEAWNDQPVAPEGMPIHEIFRGALVQMAEQVKVSSTDEVQVENKFFTNSDGIATQLRVFAPQVSTGPKPLLYWIHGGGTMSGLPEQEDGMLYQLALELNCVITSVNYRLAPENPFPKPLNDCYEGLEYVVNHASEFNIDPAKVVVGGGSAGGLLSTSVAIRARDENGPKILLQVLQYPMVDSRHQTDSHQAITDLGVWDSAMNQYGFQSYLSGVPETDYPKAVPALMADLSGLPAAFIAVGTMDCLRDESIEYAQQLARAGVKVELHIYPEMVHVFDMVAPEIDASKDFWQARIFALKRAFSQ